jgi:hypothetical protein
MKYEMWRIMSMYWMYENHTRLSIATLLRFDEKGILLYLIKGIGDSLNRSFSMRLA